MLLLCVWRLICSFDSAQFATLASSFAFIYASIQTSIETDEWIERMVAVAPVWSVKAISNTDLKRAQNAELIQVYTVLNINTVC